MTRNRVKQLLDVVMTANDIFLTEELKHIIRMEVSKEYVEIYIHNYDKENSFVHLYCGDIGMDVPHLGTYDHNLNTAERTIREMTQKVISNIGGLTRKE